MTLGKTSAALRDVTFYLINESMSHAAENPTNDAWAAGLAVALLAGFALVAAFTFSDRGHRLSLERVEEPTAAGDTRFVTPPASASTPVGTFHGKPLVGTQRVKGHDTAMRKAGPDDSGAFFIYRLDDPKERGALFIKVAEGDYLKVSAP